MSYWFGGVHTGCRTQRSTLARSKTDRRGRRGEFDQCGGACVRKRSLVGLGGGGLRRYGHAERRALAVKHLEDQLRVGAGRDRHGARLYEHRLMSTTVRSSRQLVASARVCRGLLKIIPILVNNQHLVIII